MPNESDLTGWKALPDGEPLHIELFGAHYYPPGYVGVRESAISELYSYRCYIGPQQVQVKQGDCAFYVDEDQGGLAAGRHRGPWEFHSPKFAVVVRGYAPDNVARRLSTGMLLPYVNGCATKQLFPPERPGDPTFQQLVIPPWSKEQAHHIHSTARVVYVAGGRGVSHVGMEGKTFRTELIPGMVCILDPMCPHHFETPSDNPVDVLPVHIWSTTPGETAHPMYLGTHLMNQGA